MRNSSIVIGIIISIVFFLISIYSYGIFVEYTLPKVNDVMYPVNSLGYPFRMMLAFSLACALVPLSAVLVWKLSPVISIKKKIGTVVLIIACSILAGFIRYQMIRSLAKRLSATWKELNGSSEQVHPFIPITEVNIGLWMLVGVIVGAIIAFFVFRAKRNDTQQLSF